MTRVENRQERSRIRSAEYKRKRKNNFIRMMTLLVIGIGVPLFWYGAVEFGRVQPIHTREFQLYANLAWMVVVLAFMKEYNQYQTYELKDKQIEEPEPDAANPTT